MINVDEVKIHSLSVCLALSSPTYCKLKFAVTVSFSVVFEVDLCYHMDSLYCLSVNSSLDDLLRSCSVCAGDVDPRSMGICGSCKYLLFGDHFEDHVISQEFFQLIGKASRSSPSIPTSSGTGIASSITWGRLYSDFVSEGLSNSIFQGNEHNFRSSDYRFSVRDFDGISSSGNRVESGYAPAPFDSEFLHLDVDDTSSLHSDADIDSMQLGVGLWDADSREEEVSGDWEEKFKDILLGGTISRIVTNEVHRGSACAVCKDGLEVGSEVSQLRCLHIYHHTCILPWLRIRSTCPVCRHEVEAGDGGEDKRGYETQSYMVRGGIRERRWIFVVSPMIGLVGFVLALWMGNRSRGSHYRRR